MDAIRVLQEELKHPQGVVFDDNRCLWCAEHTGESLFRRSSDGQTTRTHTGGKPSSVAYLDDQLWFSDDLRNTIYRMHIHSKAIEAMVTDVAGSALDTPGNLAVDKDGNLLFSCPGPADGNQTGWVAARRASGYTEVLTDGLTHPSGLAFISGSLLIAEMHRQRIWIGFWDPINLSWETIRVWATVTGTKAVASRKDGPAGMAIGPDGNVYVAVYGLGLIRVFSPEGEPIRDIELPGKYPTSCAFDPSDQLGLVVAEAERGQLLSIRV